MRNFGIPKNTLLHNFGMYNAIVVASDGTRLQWNNTLGFSIAEDSASWPVIDVSSFRDVAAAVEGLVFLERQGVGS